MKNILLVLLLSVVTISVQAQVIGKSQTSVQQYITKPESGYELVDKEQLEDGIVYWYAMKHDSNYKVGYAFQNNICYAAFTSIAFSVSALERTLEKLNRENVRKTEKIWASKDGKFVSVLIVENNQITVMNRQAPR